MTFIKLYAGADIIMQLDDVVHSSVSGPRLEEATHRSTLTVDDCIVVML